MLLPLIAVHSRGSAETAYFFVAVQIASALYSISYAVGQATIAEGSFDESRLSGLLKSSALLLVKLQLPAIVVAVVGARWILSVFGREYAENSETLLQILAVGAIAVALRAWTEYVLMLMKLMRHLVVSSLLGAVATIGLALLLGHRGLNWFGWAWIVGNLLSACYAGIAIVVHRRSGTRGRTATSYLTDRRVACGCATCAIWAGLPAAPRRWSNFCGPQWSSVVIW